jgi:peptidoglycan biosynthesis protein MviN/MurJ (putative lipid II flippase)
MNLLRTGSYRRGIVLSSGLNFIARFLAFLNNVTIAFFFGTTTGTDVYFYAFATIMLLAGFMTGFSSSILIPESMRIREEEGEGEAMRFLNVFMYILLGLSLAFSAVFALSPVRIFTLLSNFDAAALATHRPMLLLAIPLVTLVVLTLFLTDILTSYKFFTLPMIASIVNSCFSIVFVLAFHRAIGVTSTLWGLLCAYAVNLTLLAGLLSRRLHWDFRLKRVRLERRITQNILFSQAGNLTTLLSGYVPFYVLSGLMTGIVTALNYGRTLAELPVQLITRQLTAVAAIKFNEQHARAQLDSFDETFQRTARFVAFVLMPVNALIFLFNREIVVLLYKRGAFDEQSVAMSSMFLRYFAFLICPMGINAVVARVYMAAKKIRQAFFYQTASNLLLIACIFSLRGIAGAAAYPISLLVAYGLDLFVQAPLLRAFTPYIRYTRLLLYVLGVTGLNLAIALAVYLALRAVPGLQGAARVAAGSALYLITILGINFRFGINADIAETLTRVIQRWAGARAR